MFARTSLIALAVLSTHVFAQSARLPTADEYFSSQGLSKVSDGLYAETTATGASYVAINDAGRAALVTKIRDARSDSATRYGAKTMTSAQAANLQHLDDWASRFSQPQPKSEVTGDCTGRGGTGYPQLYARALSTGGTSSSGYSVRNLDFGPGTPTTNYADASTDNYNNSTTTSNDTAASISANEPRSCSAAAVASVTCSGHANPSITAFATSRKTSGPCIM
jgi:hypothetical protein